MKNILLLSFILSTLSFYGQESTSRKINKRVFVYKSYYKNGKLKERGRKKLQLKISSTPSGRSNGLMSYFKQGKWIEYYSNGNKKRKVIYYQGKLVKEVKSWNANGKLNRKSDDN